MLEISEIFQLPLRQTQGFFENLCATQKKDVAILNYSTLSRRRLAIKPVQISIKPSLEREILVDSTGIKTFGDGEWVAQKHPESRRKKWLKCHIAIDVQTQEVVVAQVSTNSVADCEAALDLIKVIETPIKVVLPMELMIQKSVCR